MNELIQVDPKIMMGKPTIKGTRITVESILERLAAGEPESQILEAHPQLNDDMIRAAISCGADALRADVVYPIAEPAV